MTIWQRIERKILRPLGKAIKPLGRLLEARARAEAERIVQREIERAAGKVGK